MSREHNDSLMRLNMHQKQCLNKRISHRVFLLVLLFIFPISIIISQEQEYESINSDMCYECHEKSAHETIISKDLSHSVHEGFGCLDCHKDKDTFPHKTDTGFKVSCDSCSSCHEAAGKDYQLHGVLKGCDSENSPSCSDCHGYHTVLPSSDENSRTNPSNLPQTCGTCHENLNVTSQYTDLIDHPIEIYENSVHAGVASCKDCHAVNGNSHKIYSHGNPESTINHFRIPSTCGQCHGDVEKIYWQSIHGELVQNGETRSPVCTDCHGEHGIISPSDPRSPVSKTRLAQATCTPCHESAVMSEKYGVTAGQLVSFIDSYHGLKSEAGDTVVANCASCHGYHKILPSSDPQSSVNPKNLRDTCGECHPGISQQIANTPIHSKGETGLDTKAAVILKNIYIIAIFMIIGLMAIHWLIDLGRQFADVIKKRPQVQRMKVYELWQHHLLMISFVVLVITGFSLRFNQSWLTSLFFGWKGGFELRGIIHRIAAVVLILTTIWHIIYLLTPRGRRFFKDMFPKLYDFKCFVQKILFNLNLSKTTPKFKRFSYVEKAEYWALIWGTAVMIITGIFLWFDNFFVQIFPEGILDVALVVHYYEAILASLAILIWHMYATVFNPEIYPMNPAWITGRMPKKMFNHEHSGVLEKEMESEGHDRE